MRHLVMAYLLGILLVTLLADPLNAQRIFPREADSLLVELQTSKPDTNRIKIWIRLGEYQVYKPGEFPVDMDSARTYAQQALALSQRLGYYAGEGKSLNLMGTISRESRAYDQAITYQQSAIKLFKKHSDLKGEAKSYLFLAQAMRDNGNQQAARKEIQKAIAIYTRSSLGLQAEAYLELGNTYANSGDELEIKIKNYQQALQLFTQEGDKKRQADVHKYLGDLHLLQEENVLALLDLKKSLALYHAIDKPNDPELPGVYGLLGACYSAIGDHQAAIKHGLLGVKTAEALKDSSLELCTIYNRMGMNYFFLKEVGKAQVYFKKSLLVAERYNHGPSIVIVTRNLVTVLTKLKQHDEALRLLNNLLIKFPPDNFIDSISFQSGLLRYYTAVGKYDLAQKQCDLLVRARNSAVNELPGMQYRYIIQFFLASKQLENARRYLIKHEAYCKRSTDPEGISEAELWRFQIDSMKADYPSAIKHYQRHVQLEDSLLNEAKSRQIADLELLYETEKKENDLQLKEQRITTLNKESLLQSEQIQKDRLIRNVIIGGAILLSLLLGVTYNRYRLKQRSNWQLQAQQGEINQKNGHLSNLLAEQKHLLNEKEWLLKEIHHRVKNNLQIVMSLLNSQSAYIDNEPALTAIHDSQHRVHAMSLIHQKLYYAENVSSIDMSAYIRELGSYLADSFNTKQRIRFEFDIEPLVLDVSQAVPVGLILNEAITNSLKYAFPDDRNAVIAISLSHIDLEHCLLCISDNGVGISTQFKNKKPGSLGMSLIEGLSEDLDGNFSIENNNGTIIKISFEHDRSVKRPVLTNQV